MNKIFKKYLTSAIISSVILIALGLLLIFRARDVMFMLSYVVGAILVALGTVSIIRFLRKAKNQQKTELEVAYGLISIILGIIVISHPQGIASIVPIILGIAIIINSANKFDYSLQLKAAKISIWKATMLIAIISTICGIVLLFNPFAAAEAATKVIGIFIIIYAILDIVSALTVRRNVVNVSGVLKEIAVQDADVVEEKEESEEDNKEEKVDEEKPKTQKKPKKKNKKEKKDE